MPNRSHKALTAALLLSPLAAMPAAAQSVEKFYAGKTINLIVGFGPGGTYDYFARLVARHMGKHLPGKPTIVVQNMPGAGSLTAGNHLFTVAPKDGTVIGSVSQTLAIEQAVNAVRSGSARPASARSTRPGRARCVPPGPPPSGAPRRPSAAPRS